MRIGIMSAIVEENSAFLEQITLSQEISYGNRRYLEGIWLDNEIVLVFSRWGKVAAALTATQLISKFKVDGIIFTGIAGACAPEIKIGDIIIADSLVQHDMDASPIFPRYEVPLTGLSHFQSNKHWRKCSREAAESFLNHSFHNIAKSDLNLFGITKPKVHEGCIATGDKFFASRKELAELCTRLPEVLCVEMEGGAVAQVCHEFQIPFSVIRTISDSSDEATPELFPKFIASISSQYALGILTGFLKKIQISDGTKE